MSNRIELIEKIAVIIEQDLNDILHDVTLKKVDISFLQYYFEKNGQNIQLETAEIDGLNSYYKDKFGKHGLGIMSRAGSSIYLGISHLSTNQLKLCLEYLTSTHS